MMRNPRALISLLQRLQTAGADQTAVPVLSTIRALCPAATASAESSRSISTSFAAHAATELAVDGDADGLLKEIDRAVSAETAGAKEVADAAVALAYLQAKGNRRLWGKVFERAAAAKASFDASSLSAFFWAASTAGVGHFKTLAELAGPAAALLPSLTPTQLSIVVEGLGRAGVNDAELLARVADAATPKLAAMSGPELARLVWGLGAAGSQDAALAKAAAKAVAAKAGELGGREAAQAVWGLARLRMADKASLDALVRAAKGKLESGVDAAGLVWGLGFIGYKPDADTAKSLAASLKSGAGELTPAHAIDAAWGLGVLGAGDKDSVGALFAVASAAIEKAPDALDPFQLAALFEAAALTPDAKLPEQVSAYAAKMHALVEEGARAKSSGNLQCFREDLAHATARAMGARYRPEVKKAVAAFPVTTAAGVHIDIGVPVDGSNKVAIEAVGPHYLSSVGTPLGPALSRAALLSAQGYKAVLVPYTEWAAQGDAKAKAAYLLAKVKAAVPSASSKLAELQRKLDEPFDPSA